MREGFLNSQPLLTATGKVRIVGAVPTACYLFSLILFQCSVSPLEL